MSDEYGSYRLGALNAEMLRAYSFLNLGDIQNAFQILETVTNERIRGSIQPSGISRSYFHRLYGEAYSLMSPPEYDKAQSYLEKSIENFERYGIKVELGRSYASYGKMLKQKGDSEKAEQYLSKAINLFKECGAKVELTRTQELVV